MKNLILRFIYWIMNFFGVSLNEVGAFVKRKKTKLPLKVLYTDGTKSFYVEADKIPLAILLKGVSVGMEDIGETINLNNAQKLCKQYSGGCFWIVPSLKQLKLIYKSKNKINTILISFGKEPLKDANYWSSSEFSGSNAWGMNLSDGSVNLNYIKYNKSLRSPGACFLMFLSLYLLKKA